MSALPRLTVVAVTTLCLVALVACGESSEEKAMAQVCSARADISTQLQTLKSLTLSTQLPEQVQRSLTAIGKDITQIKDAQPQLNQARKEQVQSATNSFEAQLKTIATEFASNLSLEKAASQLRSAASALASSYTQTLQPIECQ